MIDDEDLLPELELDAGVEDDDEEAHKAESEGDDAEADTGEDGSDDEVIVQIGEDSPPQEDANESPTFRQLRKGYRDTQRENKQLKTELSKLTSTGPAATVELGEKPTLIGLDYDAERYELQIAEWYDRKNAVAEQEQEVAATERAQKDAWDATISTYGGHRDALKVKDFDDAEMVVRDELSDIQQNMILNGAENSALLVYALGKNPKKAKELALIADPLKFAFAVAKLETTLKVTNRKASTKPESTITGKAQKSGSVDSTLERLRAQAEKTGDMSKVVAYKRSKRSG